MLSRLVRQLFRRPAASTKASSILAMGQAAHGAGHFDEAEACFRQALSLAPDDSNIRFHLGVSLHAQGQLHEAWNCCARALDVHPENDAWRKSVMHLANDIGKREGIDTCKGWVALQGDFAAHLALGNALRQAGRLDEAVSAYEKALRLDPGSIFAQRRLGCVLAAQGEFERADACFRHSAKGGLRPDGLVRLSAAFLDEIGRATPELTHAWPHAQSPWHAEGDGPVLLVSGDAKYVHRFAYPLVDSALKNSQTSCRIHIHVVNPGPETDSDIQRIRAELASAGYSWEMVDLANGWDARTYYACARWLQLPRVMDQYKDTIVLLDLDLLVTGNLGHALDAVRGSDIGLLQWHSYHWDPWESFTGSVAVFAATNAARSLAACAAAYVRRMFELGEATWFLDQMAIYVMHVLSAKGLRQANIGLMPVNVFRVAASLKDQPDTSAVLWSLTYSDHAGAELPDAFLPYLPAAELVRRAQAAYAGGDLIRTESLFRRALERTPDDPRIRFELGACCHALGRSDEALRLCHEAYELRPSEAHWVEGVKNISNDVGKEAGVKGLGGHPGPEDDYVTCLALGNALREAGNLIEAAKAYEQALVQKPSSPFVARRLASLLAVAGQLERADELFRVSEEAGLWPDGAMHLGDSFFRDLERERGDLMASIPKVDGPVGGLNCDVVIYISGDCLYVRRFAFALINSVLRNGGMSCNFHLHVVDPDDSIHEEMTALARQLGVRMNITTESSDSIATPRSRTYYACARFLHLPGLLKNYRCPLLLLDLDQLVLGSLQMAQQAVRGADVGMIRWHESKWDPWDTWWASAIWFQPTAAATNFAEWVALYVAKCLRDERDQWYLDQCALFGVSAWLGANGGSLRLARFPSEWATLGGGQAGPDTLFWSVIYSLKENHHALSHELFGDYNRGNPLTVQVPKAMFRAGSGN